MGGRAGWIGAAALWCGMLLARPESGADAARPEATALALSVVAVALAIAALRRRGRSAAVWLAAALFAAGLARGLATRRALELERAPLDAGGNAWLAADVVEPPETESGSTRVVLSVREADPPLRPGTRVRVWLPEGLIAEWGDRVTALARLSVPDPPRNPGGFDARGAADASRLAFQGVALAARVEPARGLSRWPRATVMRWRRALERVLHRALEPATNELVAPLVFGDRSAVDGELSAAFRSAGLTHLLALSGLHVTWLATLAAALAAALGAGVRGRFVVRGAAALFYLALAGPIPSLARASAGEAIGAAARLTRRTTDPVQLLAAAATALLVARPAWAWDLGFQLSCAATAGLVTIGPALEPARGPWRAVARAIAPTIGAQVASLPLLMLRFHALAWTSLLTNLVAVPLTGLMLTAAWLGALLELAVPGTGIAVLHSLEPQALLLRWIVEGAHHVRGALIATGAGDFGIAIAAAGAGSLALGLARERRIDARAHPPSRAAHHAALAGAILVAIALMLGMTQPPLAPPAGRFWVVVLDVGQGDAIALGLGRQWWLVDAGPRTPRFDAGQSVVLPFFRWAAARRLHTLVLTHDDSDHVGGAHAVLEGMDVARTLGPAPRPFVPGPLARVRGAGIRLGQVLDDRPRIVVRWPPPPDSARTFWEHPVTSPDNGAVAVLEIGSGAGRALLAADADSAVERALDVAPGLALLKVAHHGSGSSSGAAFLARVRPRLAALSVGRNNRFGHPDPGAIERLAASGARVMRTDSLGALWFELSDEGPRVLDWRSSEWRAGAETPRQARPRAPSP